MNDVYIIKTQEEYDAVLTRLSLLENNIKYKRVKETNFVEIMKLNNAVKDWERRKYREMYDKLIEKDVSSFGFFDD
jgi:hypothetical protein